jgi:hypothetical protein
LCLCNYNESGHSRAQSSRDFVTLMRRIVATEHTID